MACAYCSKPRDTVKARSFVRTEDGKQVTIAPRGTCHGCGSSICTDHTTVRKFNSGNQLAKCPKCIGTRIDWEGVRNVTFCALLFMSGKMAHDGDVFAALPAVVAVWLLL